MSYRWSIPFLWKVDESDFSFLCLYYLYFNLCEDLILKNVSELFFWWLPGRPQCILEAGHANWSWCSNTEKAVQGTLSKEKVWEHKCSAGLKLRKQVTTFPSESLSRTLRKGWGCQSWWWSAIVFQGVWRIAKVIIMSQWLHLGIATGPAIVLDCSFSP